MGQSNIPFGIKGKDTDPSVLSGSLLVREAGAGGHAPVMHVGTTTRKKLGDVVSTKR